MGKIKRIGVLTGGGDCPGLNAVLRGLVKTAAFDHSVRVVGFLDGFAGLIRDRTMRLESDTVSGILPLGGTILGSSNKDNPFRVPGTVDGKRIFEDRSDEALQVIERVEKRRQLTSLLRKVRRYLKDVKKVLRGKI